MEDKNVERHMDRNDITCTVCVPYPLFSLGNDLGQQPVCHKDLYFPVGQAEKRLPHYLFVGSAQQGIRERK